MKKLNEYRVCHYCSYKRGRYKRSSINVLGWVMLFFRCDNCSSEFSEEFPPEGEFKTIKLEDVDEHLRSI